MKNNRFQENLGGVLYVEIRLIIFVKILGFLFVQLIAKKNILKN